jgi:hypothetical protein
MPPKPPVIVTVVGSKHNFEALHLRYNKTFNESGNACLDNIIKYLLLPLYPQLMQEITSEALADPM